MRRLIIGAAMAVSACASYSPRPLAAGGDPTVMSPPVAAVLLQDGLAIRRPYLRPVEIDLSRPLDANAIAVLAVIANPDLKALRLRAGVADAQAFAARLLPDPTFSSGINKVLSGPDLLLDLANALLIDVNALRTRTVRRAQADAQSRQVRLDLAWAEWQTAGQARLQAIRIQSLERSLALAAQSGVASQSLLARTLRAAGRGDLTADRVQVARLGTVDAQQRLRQAERDLGAARFGLARLLGLPPSFPITIAPNSLPADPPPAETLFAVARDSRFDLQALRAGYDAQEAATHKAVLDQFPTLGLTINANRDSAGNALLGPAVDFTLPLWNRNRGGIAVEQATREALRAEYDARLFQTRAQIAAAAGGIAIARRQRAAVLRDLPALEKFAAASRRAADRGDLAAATAETAEQTARDRRLLLAQTEQDLSEQSVALELLTGTPREDWIR